MPSRIALALTLAVAGPSAAFDLDHDADDPRGRIEARRLLEGERTPEGQVILLKEAAREAARFHVGAERFSAVPGNAWINIGPAAGSQQAPFPQSKVDSGRIRKIVPHPTDANILYIATAGGGVWKTFDAQAVISASAGPHWTNITAGVGSQSVGAFALDPNSPDTLYLGLGDPFDVQTPGFYTSADGGITWEGPVLLTGLSGTATSVRDIVVNGSNTGTVLVATDAGLFRSNQGGIGATWTFKQLGNGSQDAWSVAWVGGLTWLCTAGSAVWRSNDDGVSWSGPGTLSPSNNSSSNGVGRMTLAAAPSDRGNPGGATVYLQAASPGGGSQVDVFKSVNGGQTWTSLQMDDAPCTGVCRQPAYWTNDQDNFDVMHDQAWYNQAIVVDPQDHNKFFFGGNLAAIRCDSGDKSQCYVITDWLPISPTAGTSLPYVHADWHAMAISTTGGSKYFYGGSDGGLFRSSDVFAGIPSTDNSSSCYRGQCIHFEDRLNRGIVTHLLYSVATDLHDSTNPVMIGGLQDNGTRLRSAATPTVFTQVWVGDGFGVGLGISNSSAAASSCRNKPGSLLVATVYSGIARSVDCGVSFATAMNGICNSPTLFTGDCGLDFGSNFLMKMASDQAITTAPSTFVTVINNSDCPNGDGNGKCVPASGKNSVFASTNGASSWASANGTITLQGGGTASYFPSQLGFVGTNPLHAGQWAVSTYYRVYTTLNAGGAWQESSILAGPVRGVAFENNTGTVIWAVGGADPASNSGHVFRSADRGATWVDKTANLPNVPGKSIAVDPNSPSTIYLGTEIGLYRSTDAGQSWSRYGTGLPLVMVTEINVALDSSAIRISTFGRGFWELYPSGTSPSGVYGNGDFDKNQIIDGFDLVREAAVYADTPQDADYDATGNLTGATNTIDGNDVSALVSKLGGRP